MAFLLVNITDLDDRLILERAPEVYRNCYVRTLRYFLSLVLRYVIVWTVLWKFTVRNLTLVLLTNLFQLVYDFGPSCVYLLGGLQRHKIALVDPEQAITVNGRLWGRYRDIDRLVVETKISRLTGRRFRLRIAANSGKELVIAETPFYWCMSFHMRRKTLRLATTMNELKERIRRS